MPCSFFEKTSRILATNQESNLGSALQKNLGLGAVSDNGYSTGTGSAYGGTTVNGVFTPYRQGM
jgi:hypothetical protein